MISPPLPHFLHPSQHTIQFLFQLTLAYSYDLPSTYNTNRKLSVVAATSAGSSPGSTHNSHDHGANHSLNHSRTDKADKGHHPTTASTAHSAHNTPGHTPRDHLIVVKYDHHHATSPDKDHGPRNVMDKLEQKMIQQLGSTGKSDSGGTAVSSSKPASRHHSQKDKTSSSHHVAPSDKDKGAGGNIGQRRHSKVPTPLHTK